MILLLTNGGDSTAPLVERELSALGTDYFRFNTEQYGTSIHLGSRLGAGKMCPLLHEGMKEINGNHIRSIWNRRPVAPISALPAGAGDSKVFAEEELQSAMHGWLRSLDARWMSHPDSIRNAGHKLLQLRKAKDIGFRIPETLVSSIPGEIRQFHENLVSAGSKMAAKLISKGPPRAETPEEQYVVFTQLIGASDLRDDRALSLCPALYQEYIEKAFELRVTMVGNEMFACEIHSQNSSVTRIDWRRYDFDNTPHLIHSPSPELLRMCRKITEDFGLEFAAIDLIVTPGGEFVFLELNPNGQWGWIEELTGLPIANAIARHLAGI